MELPIQLKFFKKIELYQEYLSQERKIKISKTHLKAWENEKEILKWVRTNHHHLGSLLTREDIKNRIFNTKDIPEFKQTLQNLVQRNYAEFRSEDIVTTQEGLLMAEVVYDLESEQGRLYWLRRKKYRAFFVLVWLTALSGVVIVVGSAIQMIQLIPVHLIAQKVVCFFFR